MMGTECFLPSLARFWFLSSESGPTAAREVLVVRRPAPSTERSELRPAALSADSNTSTFVVLAHAWGLTSG